LVASVNSSQVKAIPTVSKYLSLTVPGQGKDAKRLLEAAPFAGDDGGYHAQTLDLVCMEAQKRQYILFSRMLVFIVGFRLLGLATGFNRML